VSVVWCVVLEDDTATLLLILGLLVGGSLVDLADKLKEDLVDVDSVLGGGLEEGASELVAEVLALVCGDLSFVLQIALVADNDEGDTVAVLHAADLVAQVRNVVEGRVRRDRVHKHKALAAPHVLVSHRRQLLLPGSVQYLQHARLPINLYLLPV